MHGDVDNHVTAQGDAQLVRDQTVVQGDSLSYDRTTDMATADGNVKINREGNIFTGPHAEIQTETTRGFFQNPRYQIGRIGAHGEATRIDFRSRTQMTAYQVSYTTCELRDADYYDWLLTADRVDIDWDANEGVAHNAVLRFKNIPILALPVMSFPVTDARKSGWLPPTLGLDSDSGFTYVQPYYWNIAPNYDATITPMLMTSRGQGLSGEFRYLEPSFHGSVNGTFMPNDKLRDGDDRWGISMQHAQHLADSVPWLGSVDLNAQVNRVSDDNYWRDFPDSFGVATTQRLLNSEGTVTTNNGPFSTLLRVQRWQTLQDVDDPITPPYNRDQAQINYTRSEWNGFDFKATADATRFTASQQDSANNVNGTRSFVRAEASYPLRSPGAFVVPKLQAIARSYQFDETIAGLGNSASVTVPTASVDSGLVFERPTSLFGHGYTQTLEPRLFYTYTPYRDQSKLPLYDTAAYDYNFATLYTENPYAGYDRIADSNTATVGVGTRWLDPETGDEALSLNVAQRLRFSDQNVTLDNQPLTSRYGDVLFGAGVGLIKNWHLDHLQQFSTDTHESQRILTTLRWKPGQYRALNLGYRFLAAANGNPETKQIETSWQWPLGSPWAGPGLPAMNDANGRPKGRWFAVGRVNYSIADAKPVDTTVGFEYQSCCWIGRFVAQRLTTGQTQATTRFLFQIEFTGFSRLGINPIQALQNNIPHYQVLQQEPVIPQNDFRIYE